MASNLLTRLQSGDFVVTAEITPPVSTDPAEFISRALPLKGLATAVNVTDGAGAKVHLSSLAAAHFLVQNGIEPISQMTCRRPNRPALPGDPLGALDAGEAVRHAHCRRADRAPREGARSEGRRQPDLRRGPAGARRDPGRRRGARDGAAELHRDSRRHRRVGRHREEAQKLMFDLITRHGLALIFANVLLEQLGVPLPAIPTLIVAGALAVDGTLSAPAVFGVAFAASMIGDSAWYLAGRRYGRRVMTTLCRISLSPDSCVRQTESHFERWGGITLVLGKFIPGLATITPPLAGAMRIRWRSFLLLNGAGTALWAAAPIALGMLFYAQIERLVGRLQDLGAVALEVLGALLAGYVAVKWWERRRFYRMLRMARITAEELRHLMDSGRQPVIIDVRSRAERELDARSLPGALAFEVEELEELIDSLPADRDVIFYCTCPNEASAARAAKRLIDRGYTRARPLRGGLDAWIAAGYAIELRTRAPRGS